MTTWSSRSIAKQVAVLGNWYLTASQRVPLLADVVRTNSLHFTSAQIVTPRMRRATPEAGSRRVQGRQRRGHAGHRQQLHRGGRRGHARRVGCSSPRRIPLSVTSQVFASQAWRKRCMSYNFRCSRHLCAEQQREIVLSHVVLFDQFKGHPRGAHPCLRHKYQSLECA